MKLTESNITLLTWYFHIVSEAALHRNNARLLCATFKSDVFLLVVLETKYCISVVMVFKCRKLFLRAANILYYVFLFRPENFEKNIAKITVGQKGTLIPRK